MLMRTHDGRIDHSVFIVGIGRQRLKNTLPDAAPAPTGAPGMDHREIPEPLRQITPGNTSPLAISHRFDKQAIVLGCSSDMSFPTRQPIRDPLPLVISLPITSCHHCLALLAAIIALNAQMTEHAFKSSINGRPQCNITNM
jgi:hypothetical protein